MIKEKLNSRFGFFLILTLLLWAKNLFAYLVDFDLRLDNALPILQDISFTCYLASYFLLTWFIIKNSPIFLPLIQY